MEIGYRKCDQMLAENVMECEAEVRPMLSNVGFMVSGGAKMLSNVIKMLINVGNWMSEMWSNVGRKCHGMWVISSANVIECLLMLNVSKCKK